MKTYFIRIENSHKEMKASIEASFEGPKGFAKIHWVSEDEGNQKNKYNNCRAGINRKTSKALFDKISG